MNFGFTNSMRFIYTDGRDFTDPDTVVYTYNGESIGKWEGKALVVKSKYFEPNEHYIDGGIPISDQFEMTERFTMLEDGKTLQIDYTMTDPKDVEGRVEEHQALAAHGRERHSGSGVPAQPQQEPAQYHRGAEGGR